MRPDVIAPLVKTLTAQQITAFESCAADLIGRPDEPTIHTDEAKAREAGLRGPLIASGMLTVALLNEYLVTRFGSVWHQGGHLAVAFVAPTRAGDTVTVDASVISRESTSEGELISLQVWCDRQDGQRATVGTAELRVRGRAR
jgi:acyl dehydratase